MKQRPILFSTPMVQAILEGRKTQTRRVVKMNGNEFIAKCVNFDHSFMFGSGELINCPYGQPGDVLWVRETFRLCQPYGPESLNYQYKDGEVGDSVTDHYKYNNYEKWKPSIHMPKDAARIWLEIVSVRVERLQDISWEDAVFEGVERRFNHLFSEPRYKDYLNKNDEWRDPRTSFESLWQSINGAESWNSNPFVWVVEFKQINKPQ